MLFWRQRLKYHDNQRTKWLGIASMKRALSGGNTTTAEKRAWRRFHRHDKWLYNYYRNEWLLHMKIELKDWHPYGAFGALPQLFMDMVDCCYHYWHMGYNVMCDPAENKDILESTEHAFNLAQECRCAEFGDNYPTDKLVELFNYVANHVNTWGD